MGTFGIQEILVLIIVILVLQKTGLWRIISDGLRELRGERPTGAGGASGPAGDYRFFFQSLGISPSAPWEEIERAYRAKAKLYHPDGKALDEDHMRALNEAYDELKRLRRRR